MRTLALNFCSSPFSVFFLSEKNEEYENLKFHAFCCFGLEDGEKTFTVCEPGSYAGENLNGCFCLLWFLNNKIN